MGLFSRKNSDNKSNQTPAQHNEPYEVDNELDLTRDPATVRVRWSDGRVTHHKPGSDYTR